MLHQTLYHLRNAFRHYVSTQAPDIASFGEDALNVNRAVRALDPATLPATSLVADTLDLSCPATAPLVSAIIAAAPHLAWKQSYALDDEGFDQNYLDTYGWFNLIAPSGPFVSDDLRLSVGYWGQGLHYPRHWHEPEEIYLTLAGSALYISEGREPVLGTAGATICHSSNQPHSARFDKEPLLAAAFWRSNNLEAKSGLGL